MRILLITHDFEPMRTPRAFRWAAIARAWTAEGHTVHVVCAPAGGRPSEEREGPLHVHRAGGWFARLRTRVVTRIESGTGRRPSRSTWRRIHDATWKRLYWPDYAFYWRRPSLRAATRLQRERAFDALVTVSPTFTAHRVGLAMKQWTPRLPWVADFGDPFSFAPIEAPNNVRLWGRRNHRAESSVLRHADHATTPTQAVKAAWMARFPSAASKMHVVPPMFLPVEPGGPPFFADTGRRRLLYTGALYARLRNPGPVLRIFSRLQNQTGHAWELHFIGETRDVVGEFRPFKEWIGREIFLHGVLDRGDTSRAVRDADVLVNIGNASPLPLASKLFEFFAARKPVLNVVSVWPDASADYVGRYPVCLTVPVERLDSDPGVWDEISRFVSDAKGPETAPWWLQAHAPAVLARAYIDLVGRDLAGALRGAAL